MGSNFKSYKPEVLAKLKKAKALGLIAIGLLIVAEVVKLMTHKIYQGFSGDMVDTGRLRNSIDHTESDNSTLIGTNIEYADYVFLGTSKMKGRNVVWDAVIDNKAKILNVFANVYKKEVK